jgi:hypothetical protein
MLQDLEKLAKVQDALEKHALFGTILKAGVGVVGKGLKSTGGWMLKNPLKTLGTAASAGFTAMDMASATARAGEGIAESKLMRGIPPPTQF